MKRYDPFDISEARAQNLIGARLLEARREAGLNLESLSRELKRCGLVISYKGLSKWETGETVPNAYQLMAVCRVLGIDDMLPQSVPVLNAAGRRKLAEYRDDLIASGRYVPAGRRGSETEYIDMPVYYLPASAGTGEFLDDENYDLVSFPQNTVPDGADFGVRVSGDSMEPALSLIHI